MCLIIKIISEIAMRFNLENFSAQMGIFHLELDLLTVI